MMAEREPSLARSAVAPARDVARMHRPPRRLRVRCESRDGSRSGGREPRRGVPQFPERTRKKPVGPLSGTVALVPVTGFPTASHCTLGGRADCFSSW